MRLESLNLLDSHDGVLWRHFAAEVLADIYNWPVHRRMVAAAVELALIELVVPVIALFAHWEIQPRVHFQLVK